MQGGDESAVFIVQQVQECVLDAGCKGILGHAAGEQLRHTVSKELLYDFCTLFLQYSKGILTDVTEQIQSGFAQKQTEFLTRKGGVFLKQFFSRSVSLPNNLAVRKHTGSF